MFNNSCCSVVETVDVVDVVDVVDIVELVDVSIEWFDKIHDNILGGGE